MGSVVSVVLLTEPAERRWGRNKSVLENWVIVQSLINQVWKAGDYGSTSPWARPSKFKKRQRVNLKQNSQGLWYQETLQSYTGIRSPWDQSSHALN